MKGIQIKLTVSERAEKALRLMAHMDSRGSVSGFVEKLVEQELKKRPKVIQLLK